MRKLILLPLIFITKTILCQEIDYPKAEKISVVDTFYHEYIIHDDYRWMENTDDTLVKRWIKAENKLSQKYLQKALNKYQAYNKIDKYSYSEYTKPVKKGDYYFTYAYYNTLGYPALFYKKKLNLNSKILVDPNYISRSDKIRLKGYSVSKNSKYLAYQFSRNGSDWTEVQVVLLNTKEHLKDHLTDVKFSDIEWKDDGFFYSKYPRTDKYAQTLGEEVYYHKIGTEQSEDPLVFKRTNPKIQFSFTVTSDERYFILKERNEDLGKLNIFYIDYNTPNPTIKPLLMNLTDDLDIIESRNGNLIATTTINSNTGYVVEINPENPYNLKALIPEYKDAVLLEIKPLKDKIIAIYQVNQKPLITVYNYNSDLVYSLEMPIASSVGGFSGSMEDTELIFYFTSFTLPPVVYKFNIIDYSRTLIKHTGVTFDYENIVYEEVEYLSKDSVKVPMFIIHHKDLELNGNNPTLLKAYGGFGAIAQPGYNPGIVYFVNTGGVLAYANIRGGGEHGSEWHDQGKNENKQNSFDDFNNAAEFLIKNKYTSPNKLAITGASNGGLVVAASAIQRPELYSLVVPVVGVYDMIRFENFTVGNLHTDEYGTVTDSLSFLNLLSYSPLNNIKENINYPAMLIITSENDERVPPFHSYKFAASLQSRIAQKNPILLKVVKDAGHYGSIGIMNHVRETAEFYGYVYKYLKENE